MKSNESLFHLKTLDLDAMENEAVNWGWYYDNKPKAELVRKDIAIIERDLERLGIYKTIVSVLLYKNDSITKIKYFKNSITRKIHLYIHFEGNKYCWFELPYDDFKECLEDDRKKIL